MIRVDAQNVHAKLSDSRSGISQRVRTYHGLHTGRCDRHSQDVAARDAERAGSAGDSASSKCFRTHSLSTNRLHGRAQPVWPSRKLRQTDCTADGVEQAASDGVSPSPSRRHLESQRPAQPTLPRKRERPLCLTAGLGRQQVRKRFDQQSFRHARAPLGGIRQPEPRIQPADDRAAGREPPASDACSSRRYRAAACLPCTSAAPGTIPRSLP